MALLRSRLLLSFFEPKGASLFLVTGVSSLVAAMRRAVLIALVWRVHILCHRDSSPLPANAVRALSQCRHEIGGQSFRVGGHQYLFVSPGRHGVR